MEDINAKVEVLGVLLQDIYRDINITESDEKKVLQNVCTKIYKIKDDLLKKKSIIEEKERPKKLEKLIILLNELNASNLPENYDILIKNSEIEQYACETLIYSDGTCIWDNHDILADAGFCVFAGEQDRFGWLNGCIQTKKGIIEYG